MSFGDTVLNKSVISVYCSHKAIVKNFIRAVKSWPKEFTLTMLLQYLLKLNEYSYHFNLFSCYFVFFLNWLFKRAVSLRLECCRRIPLLVIIENDPNNKCIIYQVSRKRLAKMNVSMVLGKEKWSTNWALMETDVAIKIRIFYLAADIGPLI